MSCKPRALTVFLFTASLFSAAPIHTALAQGSCPCDVPSTASTGRWEQMSPSSSPPPRGQHSLVYDSARQRLVMVGGFQSCADRTPVSDFTWEFDGEAWHQISTAHVPPLRYHTSLSYDSARQRVVMFGGQNKTDSFGDTWEYDGTDWYEVTVPNPPGACNTVVMEYDPIRAVSVLHRGSNAGHVCVGEGTTWEYDGLDWTQVSTSTVPLQTVNGHRYMFDHAAGTMVYFAGDKAWDYNGVDYSLRHDFDCGDSAIAYDFDSQRFISGVGNGEGNSAWTFSPMWEWDGSACSTYRTSAGAPSDLSLIHI